MIQRSNFRQLAEKHFQFLVTKYDFSLVKSPNDNSVRYESAKIFVNLTYDIYTYELNLNIGLLTFDFEEERPFNLPEIAQLLQEESNNFKSSYQAVTIAEIDDSISNIAYMLNACGDSILDGNVDSLEKLAQIRQENFKDMKDSWNRGKLKKLWDKKDYSSVIELLESLSALSKSEQKKLDIAKKNIGQNR